MTRLTVRCGMTALAALAALVLLQGMVQGQGRSDSKVKVQAKVSKLEADGTQELTVTVDIDKGWYIYANPVGNANFEGAETTLRVFAKNKIEKIDVVYPEGKVKREADLGAFKIHEGQVLINAKLQRARGDTGPLELELAVNACDANVCLPRGKVKLTVP